MKGNGTYDLAVVFDKLWNDFDGVTRELDDLYVNLTPTFLSRLDLSYLEPSTLACRLCFLPTVVSPTRLADRLSVASPSGTRLTVELHTDDAAKTGVAFEVVVTHQILPDEVAHSRVIPGAGLRFLDSPSGWRQNWRAC